MGADKDAHTGDSTPKCVTCAQPCVLEQTRWVCKCRRGLPDGMQRSFEALRLDGTPTAHNIRESKDSSAVGYLPPVLTHQGGIRCDLRAIRSNGISQPGNNHHDDGSMASPFLVDTKQDTLERQERQDSSVSSQADGSAHEYVPFGTHDTGDDQGQSDEDIDLEDVNNADDNNGRAHGGLVDSWLKGMGMGMGMGMDERRAGIERTLRGLGNLMNPRAHSNMAKYGDKAELSDDMEIDQ